MPDFFPSTAVYFVWFAEAVIVLGALVWLLRRRAEIVPALLGLGPVRLTPSSRPGTHVLLAFALSFGLAMLAAIGVYAADLWPVPPKGQANTFTAVSAVAFQLGMLAGLAIAWFAHLNLHAETPPPALPPRKVLRDAVLTFAVLLYVTSSMTILWGWLLNALGVDAGPQDIVTLLVESAGSLEVMLVILSAITLAPFTEEILFRVLLFRWLRTRTLRAVALLLPALLFAYVHGFIAVFVPLAVMSMILAIAYERSGHPAVPVLAHALFNLNTIALLLTGLPT